MNNMFSCTNLYKVYKFLQCISQTCIKGQLFWKILKGKKLFFASSKLAVEQSYTDFLTLKDFSGLFNIHIYIINL